MSRSVAAVSAKALRVRRGDREVLHGINLEIPQGQVTGLLGPSGCGKTTLIRAIVGAQARVTGEISVLGLPSGSRTLRDKVTYATQEASVYDDLSVAQNLRYFAHLLNCNRATENEVLSLVGLVDHSKRRVDELSGGQRRRVSLAIALLGSPELIVLDEPTVGLDPVLRTELWELFHNLAESGKTLLVSSHVMDEAMRCDHLLLMRDGELLADTTPEELLRSTGTADPESAFLSIIKEDAVFQLHSPTPPVMPGRRCATEDAVRLESNSPTTQRGDEWSRRMPEDAPAIIPGKRFAMEEDAS